MTTKRNVLLIRMQPTERCLLTKFYANVFAILDSWRVQLDMVVTNETHISIALQSETPLTAAKSGNGHEVIDDNLCAALRDLRRLGSVHLVTNMAIVSVTAWHALQPPGIAGRVISTLEKNKMNVAMISQCKSRHILRTSEPGTRAEIATLAGNS